MSEKHPLTTLTGASVKTLTPVVVSASRSTDIPAFYARWFINRLKTGYVVRFNPFNKKSVYISFSNCRVVVFWTKNPAPLMPLLKKLDEWGIHYYFQFTLNDYEKEGFEPNIPPLKDRIETFKKLSDLIGKEKVIWRFDPLIVTPQLTTGELLNRVRIIGDRIRDHTDKLVFSFIDINNYQKVKRNLVKETSLFTRENIDNAEFTSGQMNEIAGGLMNIREHWKQEGRDIALATCAEKIDLEKYGIGHNRCIDGELMKNLFREDKELVYYLNYGRLPEKNLLFTEEHEKMQLSTGKFKDKGQRKECGCMISKDIGMYNTCSHFCVYCYANTSKEDVRKNLKLHSETSGSIIS